MRCIIRVVPPRHVRPARHVRPVFAAADRQLPCARKEPIGISATDIASLLQAKAVIAAGILTLLDQVGLEPEQALYLAGGFGMHLHVPSAIGGGLLPGFQPEQVQLVGNTSLAGAYLALMDSGLTRELGNGGEQIEVVELNLQPEFESCYIEQLMIPAVMEHAAANKPLNSTRRSA